MLFFIDIGEFVFFGVLRVDPNLGWMQCFALCYTDLGNSRA